MHKHTFGNVPRRFNARTADALMTFDMAPGGVGDFLNSKLTQIDPTLNYPLTSVTYTRDLQLMDAGGLATAYTAFTNMSFSSAAGTNNGDIAWGASGANAISDVGVGLDQTVTPTGLYVKEVEWNIIDVERAMRLGFPLETAKIEAMQRIWEMSCDQVAYIGSASGGMSGIANNVRVTNVTNADTVDLSNATPLQLLQAFNELTYSVYNQTAQNYAPTDFLIPPALFNAMSQPMTQAGSESVLSYIKRNCVATQFNGTAPNFQPAKWLTGTNHAGRGPGVGGANRIVGYTNRKDLVRFRTSPLTRPVQPQFRGLQIISPYAGLIGGVEAVYPETLGYRDYT